VAYEDRGVGALPKLYGAPAYRRPQAPVVHTAERPFDPDDLPIEALRDEDGELAVAVAQPAPVSSAWADMMAAMASPASDAQYHARPAAPHPAEVVAPMSAEEPDPEPAAQAPMNAAAAIALAEPSVRIRIGGLFKGRGRGAS
jgi:hypothetical protein